MWELEFRFTLLELDLAKILGRINDHRGKFFFALLNLMDAVPVPRYREAYNPE